MLLETAYCPPVEYFALLARDFVPGFPAGDDCVPARAQIEAFEHYEKQSWRNRCLILGANGIERLQVPVVHGEDRRIGAVRIEYATPWTVRTERALDAAYQSAPYYEHYRDDLFALYERQPETLLELNLALTRFFLAKTGVACELSLTERYDTPGSVPDDWRGILHPKRPNTVLRDLGLERPYYQVFAGKFGFTPGLSILDLLFNEGPDSLLYIKRTQLR